MSHCERVLKMIAGVAAAVALGYIERWESEGEFSYALCQDIKDFIKNKKNDRIGYMEEDKEKNIEIIRECSNKVDSSISKQYFICKKYSIYDSENCESGSLEIACQNLSEYDKHDMNIDKCLDPVYANEDGNCILYYCH